MRGWRFGIRSADEGAVRSVVVDMMTLRERGLMATNGELSNAFHISLIPLRLGSEVAGRHPVRLRKSPAPGIEFGDRLLSNGLKHSDVTAIQVADRWQPVQVLPSVVIPWGMGHALKVHPHRCYKDQTGPRARHDPAL